jgi:hypothetical protein
MYRPGPESLVAREITKTDGRNISAKSDELSGTTFSIRLLSQQ